ncbi:hypothetical protein BB559_004572 [Furculomyces boomerangus]|uniref:ACT domain-containing protein n=2 Tax=Harpellales TaxID=61421 RepID=A0A2T9YE03_9FUNG|nr:hypothetical protein BB559_004572 [Furculomyces boomerangus]PVZ96675.1 hypothetical protein BB558_007400 [Smittium angustum]
MFTTRQIAKNLKSFLVAKPQTKAFCPVAARSVNTNSKNNSSNNISNVTNSSTTGMEYKHRSTGKIMPIPGVLDTLTVEQAVSNLIQITPLAPKVSEERYLFDILAQDEPGVLSSVTGIMAARGFSIDTLVAGKTEVPGLSRMTIGLKGQIKAMEQAKKQLESLVPIWAVLDYSNTQTVERESLLVKVSLVDQQSNSNENNQSDSAVNPSHAVDLMVENFNRSHEKLKSIKNLTSLFNANVVDVGPESIIIEMNAKSSRINAFLKLVRPFGILEAVRGGIVVMARSIQGSRKYATKGSDESSHNTEAEDLSNLPPS